MLYFIYDVRDYTQTISFELNNEQKESIEAMLHQMTSKSPFVLLRDGGNGTPAMNQSFEIMYEKSRL